MKNSYKLSNLIRCNFCRSMLATPEALAQHLETKHNHQRNLELPKPEDILKACAKLQKAGADLSKMTVVYDQSNMNILWIVDKKSIDKVKNL